MASQEIPCVVYAAKSTEDLRGSIPEQLQDCRAAIEERGGRVVAGEYADEAVSAFRRSRGPKLVDAMEHAEDLAEQHGAAELWAQHSDRLARGDGRSARHAVEVALWALKREVSVCTVQDPDTFRDLLYAVVTGQRNHEDSRRKGLAMTAGRRRAAARGEFIGHLPDGYRLTVKLDSHGHVKKRMVIDERRRPAIEMIFRLGLRGRSTGQIARALNDAGWLTNPRRRDFAPKAWTIISVHGILTNPRYAGLAVFGGEVVARDHWPAYITERQHERIRTRITKSDRLPKKPVRLETYLLARLISCGHCGEPLYCTTGKQLSDSSHQRRYVCASHDRARHAGRCQAPRIAADMLEAMFVASLKPLLLGEPTQELEGIAQATSVLDLSLERQQLRQASLVDDEAAFTAALERLLARMGPQAVTDEESVSQRQARQLSTVKHFETWAADEFVCRTEKTRATAIKLNKLLASWFASIAVTVTDATVQITAIRRFPASEPPSHREAAVRLDRADWTRVAVHINRPRTRCRGWSNAEIIGALRAWAEIHGRSPLSVDWAKAATNQPNNRTVHRHFHSWRKAIREAGLKPCRPPTSARIMAWNDDDIIQALKDWHAENGRPAIRNDWLLATPQNPSYKTVTRRFGSWKAAIAAAGI